MTLGCHYPNYLWVIPNWYTENWWKEFPNHLSTLNCTLDQIERVLNRSLVLLPIPQHLNSSGIDSTLLNASSFAADAVRVLALAVSELRSFDNATIDEQDLTSTLLKQVCT